MSINKFLSFCNFFKVFSVSPLEREIEPVLRHNLTLAIRNLRRHKSSFIINLVGLSTGLSCALIIFLWVNDERQVDTFHEKSERLFQVMEHQAYAEEIMTTNSTPGLLAETLKDEIPEIEHAATWTWPERYTLSFQDRNIGATGYYAGADFFELFSFDLIIGDAKSALDKVTNIVISEEKAKTLFGSAEQAMGKTIELDHDELFSIAGVFANISSRSSLQFDMLQPFEKMKQEQSWLSSWGNNGPRTTVTLHPGSDAQAVSDKIKNFVKERNEDSNVSLFLKPYAERYLHGRYENGVQVGGRIEYVRLFTLIAVFILIIACINFMNLSTARSSRRAKEVGVKKTVGAEKGTLIAQFLSESLLIAFFSAIVALILVWLALPKFNLITDKEIALQLSPQMLAGFFGITIVTGLLAGSYPALYLSSFKPGAVLKGEIRASLGELWARRGLVVFQFALSVFLIVSVFVVYKQVQFVQTKNLGYNKDNLLYFDSDGSIPDRQDAFIDEVGRLPGITQVSSIGHNLIGRNNNTSGLEWEGKDPNANVLFENFRINYDLLETIGVEMATGRTFSREFGADSNKIILNEAAIEIMGLEDPLGKSVRLWDEYDLEIVGVVKDFHFQSLHSNVNPLFFWLEPENAWNIMVRIEAGKESLAIANLKELYENYNPGFSFDYDFVDDQYAKQYAAETRVATLSRYFAGFAILISCLGLFGLAAFTAVRRRKEIGIRKVLGASVANIVGLLTKDFTRLVFISILIGLPLAFLAMQNWLDRFAYRIELSPWFFVLAGIIVLTISWMTVSTQALRASSVNPRECLKSE